MSQPAPRLHFLDSRSGGHYRSLLSEPISSLEQISRFRILLIRTGPSWSKNGKDPSCSNDNHYPIDRCWRNKPGYLVDGHAAVSFLE